MVFAFPRRLLGLETEYALRYSGWGPRPGNDQIYDALLRAVAHEVASEAGRDQPEKKQVFLQNGGAFNYEHSPERPYDGLVEGATPECTSPGQLLRYQKAQDLLLIRTLPEARKHLQEQGYGGEIGLLKNCRDAEGHTYGAQENYEVEVAEGLFLFLYRCGLVALFPFLLVHFLAFWLGTLLFLAVFLLATLGLLVASMLIPAVRRLSFVKLFSSGDERTLNAALGRVQLWMAYVELWPVAFPFCWLLRRTAFRAVRRRAGAFLISRPLLSGAGSVAGDGRFVLCEKGPGIVQWMRGSLRREARSVFDTGNLLKQTARLLGFRFSPFLHLFERRQRLQLGLSDSNCAQVAELLKVATTALVMDMVEAGCLEDAPRPRRPVAALKTLIHDPTLRERVEMEDGRLMSGLEIQRFYLERARLFVAERRVEALETREVLELWEETLQALEAGDYDLLVGRLDWVTKRFLIEAALEELPAGADRDAVAKTIDLRYHELGAGYLAQMEREGLAPVLVEPEEVHRALYEPPEDSPAFYRGHLIRKHRHSPVPLKVGWTSAWIGGRVQGRVVDFRRPPEAP